MKKDNLFFQEEPPAGHDKKVALAVQESLRRNRTVAEGSRKQFLTGWKLWASGFSIAAIAGVASILLLPKNSSENSELLAFADLDLEADDIELLSQDIDILENLDILEEMGEES